MADHGTAHDTGHGSEFVHGSMDTRTQEKTFAGFMRMVTWGAVISILVLIIMALADG